MTYLEIMGINLIKKQNFSLFTESPHQAIPI